MFASAKLSAILLVFFEVTENIPPPIIECIACRTNSLSRVCTVMELVAIPQSTIFFNKRKPILQKIQSLRKFSLYKLLFRVIVIFIFNIQCNTEVFSIYSHFRVSKAGSCFVSLDQQTLVRHIELKMYMKHAFKSKLNFYLADACIIFKFPSVGLSYFSMNQILLLSI